MNTDDIKLLADIGEYGLLDSALCRARHFGDCTPQWCRQKLARYAKAGLLRSIKLQVWYAEDTRAQGGRIPAIHCLTEQGAQAVYQWTGSYPKRVLRSDPTPFTFFHRLKIVKVRAAFDAAAVAAGLPLPSWIMEQDVRPDAPDDAMPNQRRWLYHEFRTTDGLVTCQPDAAAVLQIPNAAQSGPTNLAILFEIDLSREGLGQCRRKLPGYTALIERRTYPYWAQLSNPIVRVFWVVPSPQRIRELSAAFHDSAIAKVFRFTTFDCCNHEILTEPVWHDIDGSPLTIYRPPAGTANRTSARADAFRTNRPG